LGGIGGHEKKWVRCWRRSGVKGKNMRWKNLDWVQRKFVIQNKNVSAASIKAEIIANFTEYEHSLQCRKLTEGRKNIQ
jgi:hypothetical protein